MGKNMRNPEKLQINFKSKGHGQTKEKAYLVCGGVALSETTYSKVLLIRCWCSVELFRWGPCSCTERSNSKGPVKIRVRKCVPSESLHIIADISHFVFLFPFCPLYISPRLQSECDMQHMLVVPLPYVPQRLIYKA